jgi:hypothetical protein
MLEDKYGNFSDAAMRERLAFHTNRMRGNKAPVSKLAPSGPTTSGWDKYYFFGCGGKELICGPTAKRARNRPAADGPQTFLNEGFSKEDIQRERANFEKKGARTTYTEAFGQFARTNQADFGPPGECHNSPGPYTQSMPALPPPIPDSRIMAAYELLDRNRPEGRVRRAGPMWPPPGAETGQPERPDPLKTRSNLFRGQVPDGHRNIVDLYASDRKAPPSYHYILGNV